MFLQLMQHIRPSRPGVSFGQGRGRGLQRAKLPLWTRFAAISAIGCAGFFSTLETAQAGQSLPQGGLLAQKLDLSPRRPVLAHVRFCIVYPDQCEVRSDRRDRNATPAALLKQAQRVNVTVNRAIAPLPDVGFDSWDVDVDAGDCEDYALQKRKELLQLGWPTKALRIALTRTRHGTYHAVLLATIGGTDFVLDNMTARILPWSATPYTFLFVQDARDPKAWHDITYGTGGRTTS